MEAGVYGNGPEALVALKPQSGVIEWTHVKHSGGVSGTPVAIRGRVCLVEGSVTAILHCINVSDGSNVWQTPLPAWSQSGLAAAFGKVYVLTRSGSLQAHDLDTGAISWQATVNVGSGSTLSSPAIGFGNIYVGTATGLHAFNANSGELQWNASGLSNGNASPVIVSDVGIGNPAVVVIGSTDSKLRAYQVGTGALLWEWTGNLALWYTSPAAANSKLYLIQSGSVVEIDAVTGLQTATSPSLGASVRVGPTIVKDSLFVITGDDRLITLSLSGLTIQNDIQITAHPAGDQGKPSSENLQLYLSAAESSPWPAANDTIFAYGKQ